MGMLRTFLGNHPAAAMLLLALALAIKALVPAGYMAGGASRLLSVSICADASGGAAIRQIVLPMEGKPGENHGQGQDRHGTAAATCAYTALGMAALGGADAPLLALALVFIVLLGLRTAIPPAPLAALHLRPPLRGPPAPS